MRKSMLWGALVAASILSVTGSARSADVLGMSEGNPELQSTGQLAFGPQGVLLVGDTKAAAIVALATNDTAAEGASTDLAIADLRGTLAKALQVEADQIQVRDMAVNAKTGNVFLSLAIGEEARPGIVRIDRAGNASPLNLTKIVFSKATLADAPEDREVGEGRRRRNNRAESITDLAFVDGQVIVSGLSKNATASSVRSLVFPFKGKQTGTGLEIYHGAHGRLEDYAPIRVFVPFNIDGEPNLLAGFTCTPLVRFPLSAVSGEGEGEGEGDGASDESSSGKVRGTTVAELGNRNQPLDMIAYKKDGQDFLLMANSARGVMKVSTEDIERAEGIDEPVRGGGTAGQPYETIEGLEGVVQLDRASDEKAVVIIQGDGGVLSLRSIELP